MNPSTSEVRAAVVADATPARCADCGAPVTGHYCANCGQETHIETPTVRHFLREFVDQYIALEGKLGRTLRVLLTQPGQLTLDYLEGRRQRYVRPLKLYLTISLLFFGAIGLLPDSMTNPLARIDPKAENQALFEFKQDAQKDADLHGGAADGVATELGKKLTDRVERLAQLPAEEQHRLLRAKLANDAPYAMFFLLPYFALLLKWLYRKQRLRYGAHLLFSIHLHCFAFIVLAAGFLPLPEVVRTRLDWIVLAYLFFALRRVYGLGLKSTLWRLAALYALYVVAITATAVSGILATVLGGEVA
ncbi:MAG: DUF3667 domain-containing protein [Nevskia sp.]|nr:DUF3667 domain-containing protein [Nevskia sp.]